MQIVAAQCEQVRALVVDEEEDLPPIPAPSVAVIDTKSSMESDSIHGGCHNMLCIKENRRLRDEVESFKKKLAEYAG